MKFNALVPLFLLAPSASATWTIVVANRATGEVCVGGATCINNFDLKSALCVMRVGQGAGAAQSVIDTTGTNRVLIWNELQLGIAPDQIVADLAAIDTHHQQRQYGIVSLAAGEATFTGTQCGLARHGVTGRSGDLIYSIQGNVLTGDIVVTNAEAALLATSGDTPTRVMAAMEAARLMGGDGRCSCDMYHPTACGAPPPSFTYAAASSFLVCARMGDTDGTCSAGGCANGHYWCDLHVNMGPPTGLDPVINLEQMFTGWRASLSEWADQFNSIVTPSAHSIPADGITSATVDVTLRNIDGDLIEYTPATVTVASLTPGAEIATITPAVDTTGLDHFRFSLVSNGIAGNGRFAITVHHGAQNVLLWPPLELRADPPTPLHSGLDVVSAALGASVPLTIDAGAGQAGASYRLFASASGTHPGVVFQSAHLPLNRDRLFAFSVRSAGLGPFRDSIGLLDANGYAQSVFTPPPGWLTSVVGHHIDWAALIGGSVVVGPAGFDVAP